MTGRRQFIGFLIFEVLFWLGMAALFNARQYEAGIVICLLFALWFISMRGQETRFLVLLSGLPFQALTKLTDSTPSVAVALYLAFIILHLVKTRCRVKARNVLSFFILIALNLIASWRYETPVLNVISGLLMVLFATASIEVFQSAEDKAALYIKCAWVFALSMLVNACSALIFPDLPYYILYEKQVLLDQVGRFCALNGDPNYYGQLTVVAVGFMIALLILYGKERKVWLCILSLVTAVALALLGALSLSKGYAISLSVVLLLTVWFMIMEGRTLKQRILRSVLFLVMGGLAAAAVFYYIIQPILATRTDVDLFTNRLDIWGSYFQMFREQPSIIFLGVGFNNSWEKIVDYIGELKAAHNLYIEALGDIGVIGLIFVGVLWFKALQKRKALLNNATSLFMWGFLITSLSLSASANDIMYFVVPIFSIVFSSSDYVRSQQEITR